MGLSLSRFGFGPKYISWIRLLYAPPMASVQTNKIRSEYFRLTHSTRQGCSLSLLLFALAIEPLAASLRASKEYSGIHRGGKEHKVSLFANDLLIYISDPSKSVPAIISILNKLQLINYNYRDIK